MWLPEDSEAALEWATYKQSLCSGCGNPRHESFAIENDDKYDVTMLRCHACAALGRKSEILHDASDPNVSRPHGMYLSVSGPTDD